MQGKNDEDIDACRAAIAALEGQRDTLGDAVIALATAPLRARLAALQRSGGLQHRQVTVLFADVVGSTALSQVLDAEDTLALLSGALTAMASIVEAHQGRVLRFTGDGLKAAFGVDEAREDDAERAVRAGLSLLAAGREQAEAARRLYGIADFAVRVGVHTGDVALGAGVEADHTAMGAAVNIAARMEQSAPPGAMRISHDTWSQVRGLFDCEPQPPLQVKGVDAPMSTYLVRAALDRSTAQVERGLQGLSTPMVGRDAELQRLLDAVARSRDTGRLVALTVVGDAGLGKSRLLREYTARLEGCQVLSLRSQPDGRLRPWGLLRSLLAVQCGVADTDSAEVARRKVVDGLGPWFDEHGERQAQWLGQLSGLDFGDSPHLRGLDPRTLRNQALAALLGYLRALSVRGGAWPVLVAEDLHWADDGSLDLLQHLRAHAAELPLALVMTGRPALLERRPDWDVPETSIRLRPLDAMHSDRLSQALLQRLADVPAPLTRLLSDRAEGNPYYLEELVRRLIDDGVIVAGEPHWTVRVDRLDTLRLPATLVGLLQARLDALPADERRAARQASIIGHVFWDDALQSLDPESPRALPALQRAAIVKPHERSDFEGTAERAFDHHLLHQVTYDSLLKAERRRGHAAAARWLAGRTQGRGGEFLAMTGEHAERAGDVALAVDCFERAGHEARLRYANASAASWLRRAVALLGEAEPGRRLDMLRHLEHFADALGDRAGQEALHREMAAVLEAHPDDAHQANLWFSMSLLADRRSDTGRSEQLCRMALEHAERCGAARVAAQCHGMLAWFHIAGLAPAQALAPIERGMAWAGRIEGERERCSTEIQLLNLSAMALQHLNRRAEAQDTLRAVVARAERAGTVIDQLHALRQWSEIAGERGQWTEAVDLAQRSRTLAQAIGIVQPVAAAERQLGRAAEGLGDADAAARWHAQALATFRATGDRRYAARALLSLGPLHLARGDADAARACSVQARSLSQDLGDGLLAAEALALGAVCESRLGHTDAASAAVNEVLSALADGLRERDAHETMDMRWLCHLALTSLGDGRAAPVLEQLHADVQARASELTGAPGAADATERERLLQSQPAFRAIVAAFRRAPRIPVGPA